jgi:hypothetical protein
MGKQTFQAAVRSNQSDRVEWGSTFFTRIDRTAGFVVDLEAFGEKA